MSDKRFLCNIMALRQRVMAFSRSLLRFLLLEKVGLKKASDEYLLQQEGGILVSCHASTYLICIGNIGAKFYFERIVVEALRVLVFEFRQFQVVCGNYARNVSFGNILQEQARTVELVQRVCTFQYLVEYD